MRCGYCYREGHNQRTCDQKTEAYKRRRDRAISEGDTDSFWVREYNKRIDPSRGKKSSMTCGYCAGLGHTRRTCEVMKSDKVLYKNHSDMVLRVVHDYITNCPIGIGSLFTQDVDRWENGSYVSKRLDLVAVDFDLSYDLLTNCPVPFLTLMSPSTGETVKTRLQKHVCNRGFRSSFNVIQLVAASANPVSDDWIAKRATSISGLKEHDHFARTGNKDDDRRNGVFRALSALIGGSKGHMSVFELHQQREKWSEEGVRKALHDSLSDV